MRNRAIVVDRIQNHFKTYAFVYVVLGLAWLIFFSPILFAGRVYFQDDLKIIYYPLEIEYARFQHAWQLPQWSMYFGFGHPLLAWGQLGFFIPLHLLLRALYVHPLILLQISTMTYIALGLSGMAIWLIKRNITIIPATLGAIIFAFSGFTIGHLNHVNFFTSTMLLPWFLIAGQALLHKPTIRRASLLAIVTSILAMSGQPQVVVYTVAIGTIILATIFIQDVIYHQQHSFLQTIHHFIRRPYTPRTKIILLAIAAAGLTICLSSFAVLPLLEFLPQTERADSLPISELYEFSYPSWHAITLVLPYFFGGHDTYWGPKGFQELAAFVGFIPLWLSGMALANWRTHRAERSAAVMLLAIAIMMGLGKYSFIYSFLVENHILQSFSTPGRFVFFFDVAIAILATLGLHDLLTSSLTQKKTVRLLTITTAALFITTLFIPFFSELQLREELFTRLTEIGSLYELQWTVLLTSFVGIPLCLVAYKWKKTKQAVAIVLTLITTGSLLVYAWDYNPRVDKNKALALSPFITNIEQYNQTASTPARVYSNPELLRSKEDNTVPRKTDIISPLFTVYQPFTAAGQGLSCINLAVNVAGTPTGTVTFKLYKNPQEAPLYEEVITSRDLNRSDIRPFCFPVISESLGQTYWFSLSSDFTSEVFAFSRPTNDNAQKAFYIRKPNPTPEEWQASQKNIRLVFEPSYGESQDKESIIMARHIQVAAHASGARWIGALSIRPYREFIENFFANDQEPIDGDGLHAIERNRKILNMAGVTHLLQALPNNTTDNMPGSDYILVDKFPTGDYEARLYYNQQAFPKAFLVDHAISIPAADETRFAMRQQTFDPSTTITITGPTPPQNLPQNTGTAASAHATITTYTPTQVDVQVTTPNDVYVVVSDSSSEQWQTFIDNAPAPRYIANSVFKAAIVPAGEHTVSFRYYSPATKQAKSMTIVGIIAATLGLLPYKKLTSFFKKKGL